MFGIGGIIKAVTMLLIVGIIAGGIYYITGLRADLAVSEMNNQKLEEGIKAQQELMEQNHGKTMGEGQRLRERGEPQEQRERGPKAE